MKQIGVNQRLCRSGQTLISQGSAGIVVFIRVTLALNSVIGTKTVHAVVHRGVHACLL